MKKYVIFVIVTLCLFTVSYANVWYVHPDSILSSIQESLDFCKNNDTIYVAPGVYHENIVWPKTKGINLISEVGPNLTIIEAYERGSVIDISTPVNSKTIIEGFTIRNGNAKKGGGIYCKRSSPTIRNNLIVDNIADSTGGGIFCDHSKAYIINNIIRNNYACFQGGGIYVTNKSAIEIKYNYINNNYAFCGGAILIKEGKISIRGSIITNNSDGLYFLDSYGMVDSCVISWNYGHGIYIAVSYKERILPSIHNCNIINNNGYGIYNCNNTYVQATENWWGNSDRVNNFMNNNIAAGFVNYDLWLTKPVMVIKEEKNPIRIKDMTYLIIEASPSISDNDKMYDIMGRIIVSDKPPPGIYFIEIDGKITRKVVKIR